MFWCGQIYPGVPGTYSDKTIMNSVIAKIYPSMFKTYSDMPKTQSGISNCNEAQTHNQLVSKQTLNHLTKLAKQLSCIVSTYLYSAFDCTCVDKIWLIPKCTRWISKLVNISVIWLKYWSGLVNIGPVWLKYWLGFINIGLDLINNKQNHITSVWIG